MTAMGGAEMGGITVEATCKSCDTPGKISDNGLVRYCEVCGPYANRDVYKIENIAPWARAMIVQEGDILDDVEPISPPINDSQWLKLLQQVIPSDYPMDRNLPLEVAYEAIRNYPKVEIQRVVEHGNSGTIFYSTENPDADDDGYIPQKINEWDYQLDDEDEHPSEYDEYLPEALVENISGAFSNDPIKRVSYIKNLCKRVLHYDTFLIDPSANPLDGRQRRWCSIHPESMILRQALAEILLGHHGQEPLWRLRAGAINDTVYWKNYLSTEVWEEPRKKSFQYLRQIVEATPEIKPTPRGLVIQGESGAVYLLKARTFHAGTPIPVVLNLPESRIESTLGVCIHMEHGCKLPLGDRIAALALGLVNDIKTARLIEQLAVVVDQFQGQGWR